MTIFFAHLLAFILLIYFLLLCIIRASIRYYYLFFLRKINVLAIFCGKVVVEMSESEGVSHKIQRFIYVQ